MKNDPFEQEIIIPRAVTIVAVFVLSITIWNGIHIWVTLRDWLVLSRFGANPYYLFSSGLIWFILGFILLGLIIKSHRFTLWVGLGFSLLYPLWWWVDRFVFQVTPAPNAVFSIFVSIFFIAIFNLFLFWPSSQAFFKENQ